MVFADLVAQDSVFVDANTFTYRFQPHPAYSILAVGLRFGLRVREVWKGIFEHVIGNLICAVVCALVCAGCV